MTFDKTFEAVYKHTHRKKGRLNIMIRILALAGLALLIAGDAVAHGQARNNPNRSADQLNARVLEVLQPAPAPVAAAPAAAPAPAPMTLSGIYIGGNIGTNFRDGTDYTVGAVAGYQITPRIAAEITYDYLRSSTDIRSNDGQMVMGNLVYSRRIGNTSLVPYALAGAGVGWNGMGEAGTGNNLALYNVGGGVRLNLVSNIDIDARYRYVGAFNDDTMGNNHMVTGGLNIRF